MGKTPPPIAVPPPVRPGSWPSRLAGVARFCALKIWKLDANNSFFRIKVCVCGAGVCMEGAWFSPEGGATACCTWLEVTIPCWLLRENCRTPAPITTAIPAASAPQRRKGRLNHPLRKRPRPAGETSISVTGTARAITFRQSPQAARCSITRALSPPKRDCSTNAVSRSGSGCEPATGFSCSLATTNWGTSCISIFYRAFSVRFPAYGSLKGSTAPGST